MVNGIGSSREPPGAAGLKFTWAVILPIMAPNFAVLCTPPLPRALQSRSISRSPCTTVSPMSRPSGPIRGVTGSDGTAWPRNRR